MKQELNLDILNKELEEVKKILSDLGLVFRIVRRDGISFLITEDLQPARVNLVVENDRVVEYNLG